MSQGIGKDVILCHAPEDRQAADALAGFIRNVTGEHVWLRHFDLSAGQVLTDAISRAIEDARWFVFLLSKATLRHRWAQLEARLATFRAIRDESFKIIVLKLEDLEMPDYLKQAVSVGEVWDSTSAATAEASYGRLAQQIRDTPTTGVPADVYVGRGQASDQFSIVARRNQVVFLVGFPGIGKSAFCKHSVPNVLRRRPLPVRLSRGHSADLLARQLLQSAHRPQPIGGEYKSEAELVAAAIEAIAHLGDQFYLFLDDAEEVLDSNNKPQPFLQNAIERLVRASSSLRIVVATTRLPDYPPSFGQFSGVVRLDPIEDSFIREAIDQWLEPHPHRDDLMRSPDMDELVELAAGHPLAAKLIASQLAANKGVDELLSAKQKNRFELKLAEHILRLTEHALTPTQELLLQILTVVGEPVTMQDILALPISQKAGEGALQSARSQLSDRFLIFPS